MSVSDASKHSKHSHRASETTVLAGAKDHQKVTKTMPGEFEKRRRTVKTQSGNMFEIALKMHASKNQK